MKIEGRVSTCRRDNLITRFNKQSGKVAKQAVNSFTDHDVFRRYLMVLGNGMAKIKKFRITIFPGIDRRGVNRFFNLRRRSEYALVCADPDAERYFLRALLRLGPNKRDGRRQFLG